MINPQLSSPVIHGSIEDLSGPARQQEAMRQYMRARAAATWNHFGAEWLSNVRANIPQIIQPTSHRFVLDAVKGLPKELIDAEQIFIFAAGPSLRRVEANVHKLKGKGIIVGTPTVLPWMRHHGLEPEWLLVNDSNSQAVIPIEGSGGAGETRLLCPPTIDRRVVKLFPKKNVYWYNSLVQGEDGTVESAQFSNFMQLLFLPREEEKDYQIPGIEAWVVQAGCCTNQAIILINWMLQSETIGAKRIVLMGADYAFWWGLARVPLYQNLKPDSEGMLPFYNKGTLVRGPSDYLTLGHPPDAMDWDGMQTCRRMVLYKRSLLLYYAATAAPLLSCSQGILTEIPYVGIGAMLNGEYPDVPGRQAIAVACSGFLDQEFPDWFPMNIPVPTQKKEE